MRLHEVGHLAARFLIDAIEGRAISGRHVVPAEIVVRASTGLRYLDPEADAPRRYHDFCIHEPRASFGDGAAGGSCL